MLLSIFTFPPKAGFYFYSPPDKGDTGGLNVIIIYQPPFVPPCQGGRITMAKLTKQQTKKIADLAKLQLTDTELEKYSNEISSILEYIDLINEVDVSDIEFVSNLDDYKGDVLREDVVQESLSIDDALSNAGDERKNKNYFTVSKII